MIAFELDEDVSQNLLRSIIQLWVTIRGFSYAGALVEQYKRACGSLKRKKSLRVELRKSSDANNLHCVL